jgi:mono/diheme cytochrome c family protein
MLRRKLLTLTVALACVPIGTAADALAQDTSASFEKQVRPILKANCFQCHGEGEKLSGGLDLRLRRLIAQGGDSGPAIVPGRQEMSLLLERVSKGEMPPGKKKLTPDEIAVIGRWIAQGATVERAEPERIDDAHFTEDDRSFWAFQPIARPPEPKVERQNLVRSPIDAFLLAKLEEKGLAYSPEADKRTLIRRASFDLIGLPPTPQEVELFLADDASDSYERLIDRLLASPHYGERWGRHWLDVAGYADSEGYTNDDPVRKESFKFRDYVIRSFNADKPFDQFIHEQLAGDELVGSEVVARGYKNLPPDAIERLVATGFLRMAPDGTASGGVDQKVARNQVVADTIKIVTSSLMGLTVACAQCHNHRYDPIPQTDYYRLRAVFEPALNWKNWRAPQARLVSLYTDADRAKSAEIESDAAKIDAERTKKQQEYIDQTFDKELAKLPENMRDAARAARGTPADKRSAEQKQLFKDHPSLNVSAGSLYLYDQKAADDLKRMADEAAKIRAAKPVEEFIRALTEQPGQIPPTHLFSRGDPDQPKQTVAPGDLSILATACVGEIPADDPTLPTTGRRLAFAKKLTNGTHPLVARVLVNRVWMHHFGRGIVASPGDFGYLGERPTHPELLDWLAMEFMNPSHTPPYEGGKGAWRLKRLHKMIMTSAAYRQSSRRDPAKEAVDPDNRLLGRMPVRRLEAEVLRDSVLDVSGKLNVKMFGAPVPIKEDEVGQVVVGVDTTDSAGRPTGKVVAIGDEESRRSLYVQVRRTKPLALLDTFDVPAMEPNCEARNSSTVAPQSLLLMNNEFVIEHARHLAERVTREAGADLRAQIVRAWRLAFAREPNDAEISDAVALIGQQADQFRANPPAPTKQKDGKEVAEKLEPQLQALAVLCQALLSANEFLYVD